VEVEHRLAQPGHSAGVRLLAYINAARSGAYDTAVSVGGIPDVTAVRRDGTRKHGFGLNAEYELAKNVGSFLRYGWSDGKTESWAFNERDG
jgi:high affinity Mn2+ porin